MDCRISTTVVADPKGHRMELDVAIEKGKIEDLLELGVRTDPPIMTGLVRLKTKFDLPPGEPDVPNRSSAPPNHSPPPTNSEFLLLPVEGRCRHWFRPQWRETPYAVALSDRWSQCENPECQFCRPRQCCREYRHTVRWTTVSPQYP